MPLDTCITNVGEYYSSHYLESTFTKDVKELVKKWNEQGSEASPRRLQNLSQHYFRAKTQVLDEEEPIHRQFAGDDASGWHSQFLHALGYTALESFDHPTEGGDTFVPVLGRVNRYNKPWLVISETHFCLPDGSLKEGMPSEDPLGMQPHKDQLQQQANQELCKGDWGRCVGRIFTEEDAPRWILLLAGSQILLLDRNTYAQGRFLAFDLDDAFGRKEKDTFNHIAAFLSADTLCPEGESDEVLLDKLEEQSHRFAHGVTDSLQFAVREAIELLVNDWARDRTERERKPLLKLYKDEVKTNSSSVRLDLPELDDRSYEITAEHLRREALTFVYRLLFCFYAEARGGELEILPVDDNIFRLGYSLESLRDLELVPLTDATSEGTYFHQHLKTLFRIIHDGFHPNEDNEGTQYSLSLRNETVRAFEVRPLTATLFSPDSTPLLNRAQLSNGCLQQVIRNLSLSTDKNSKTIGRVNYAELGINQLGAVYEGLLSYKGMFADQELINVKPAKKDFSDKKTPTWFVPKDRLEEFKKDEVERLPDGKPRIYPKGEFILHLNGIDREQSASYYTPEVLTKCLVEEALRELLKDYTPDDADKILSLKICEPAMGSGAFLNEAAEQLAMRYLELKQKQLQEKFPEGEFPVSELKEVSSLYSHHAEDNQQTILAEPRQEYGVLETGDRKYSTTIEPARFGDELRRVKHYIATNNIYGVDLNETAVELGQLSLWLGSIHRLLVKEADDGGLDIYQSGATPWFGLRLRCGNSLIGARRAVWTTEQLQRGEHALKSKVIQQIQADIEQLQEHTTPKAFTGFRKQSLDLIAKIKWDEFAEDTDECRNQVVRFCECTREQGAGGLSEDERKLYEKRRTIWKRVLNKNDQDELLALYDLLPDGRIRECERMSFDVFLTLDDQHSEFKAGLPRFLKPGESRGQNEIFHFLVFDPEMVPTRSDKLMKSFWKYDCEVTVQWINKEVTSKWIKEQINEAIEICDLIDQHWQAYAQQRANALDATTCTATVWPIPANSPEAVGPSPSLVEQEKICRELESSSGSFQRLSLVMDTWCSFWFWPLTKVENLPSREAFLASTRLLLSGERKDKSWNEILSANLGFEIDVLLQAAPEDEVPDAEMLAGAVPWFGVAGTIRDEQKFHHWELVFVEIIGEVSRVGGFDLIIGNPPWIKIGWDEKPVVCELASDLGCKEPKSAAIKVKRTELLVKVENQRFYSTEFRRASAIRALLASTRLEPLLQDTKTNTYKNFLVRSWLLLNGKGIGGLIHEEGIYEDPNGGSLRRAYFERLVSHFQFRNELRLFSDVEHTRHYSLNVFRGSIGIPSFRCIFNLFHPSTITICMCHNGNGLTPGMRNTAGAWELNGHRNRVVEIDEAALRLFRDFIETTETPVSTTRLLRVHSQETKLVLEKMIKSPMRLGDKEGEYFPSELLNETTSQSLKLIERNDSPPFQPSKLSELIWVGAHFGLANPFARRPWKECTDSKHYDDVDLMNIGAAYIPSSVYRPLVDSDRFFYEASLPELPFRPEKTVATVYRHANRIMVDTGMERTVISCIIPRDTVHINGVLSIAFRELSQLVLFAGTTCSILSDFLIRLSGTSNCRTNTLEALPWFGDSEKTKICEAICHRTLRLNCLSDAYQDLWREVALPNISSELWTSDDPKLMAEKPWDCLSHSRWDKSTPLRTDFGRRQALLEIDVLIALMLEVSIDELITIYRTQFPITVKFEGSDEYDARGSRLFNSSRRTRGSSELNALRKNWNGEGDLEVEWPTDGGTSSSVTSFTPPFTKVDREADYARAWEEFEKRYVTGGQS